VGRVLFSTTACGVDEGVVVGITAAFVDVQAAIINSPSKQPSTSNNIFVI
jgi:hypothetical protein